MSERSERAAEWMAAKRANPWLNPRLSERMYVPDDIGSPEGRSYAIGHRTAMKRTEDAGPRDFTAAQARDFAAILRDVERLWRGRKPVQELVQIALATAVAPGTGDPASSVAMALGDMSACREAMRCAHLRYPNPEDAVREWSSSLDKTFISRRAHALGAPNIFRIGSDLLDALVHTDLQGALSGDVRLPFGGFYIACGTNERLHVSDGNRLYPVSLIGVAESSRIAERGRSLVTIAWGEPTAESTSWGDDAYSIGYAAFASAEEEANAAIFASIGGIAAPRGIYYDGVEVPNAVTALVMNFCLYLATRPKIRRAGSGKVVDITEITAAPRTSVAMSRKPLRWDVGGGETIARRSAADVVVRGHWRNQACGARMAERRVIWIAPHVRNSTGAVAAGHDYVWAGAR